MNIGEKILGLRTKLRLTQAELGERCGVSARSVYTWESGKSIPRKGMLIKLAYALETSVDYLKDPNVSDPETGREKLPYIDRVAREYGFHAAKEVDALLEQTAGLFAGGTLDEAGKDAFFQALVDVYAQSKVDAKAKYGKKSNDEE